MQKGIITQKDTENLTLIVDGKLYKAKISKDLVDVKIGQIANVSHTKSNGFLKHFTCNVLSYDDINLENFNQDTCLLWPSENIETTFDVIEREDNFVFVSEGIDLFDCIKRLQAEALKANCNLIYDLKISFKSYSLSKKAHFIVSGKGAIIKDDRVKLKSGMHIHIDKKILRVNSPNDANVRYVRVLLGSCLIILIPIILRTSMLHGISLNIASIFICFVILLSLTLGLYANSNKNTNYKAKANFVKK